MTADLDIEKQSVCVGRYALEIPIPLRRQQKSIASGGDVTFYFGHDETFTKIDATAIEIENAHAFESAVLSREGELKRQQNFFTDGSMFVSREDVRGGVNLISYYASADSTDAIRIEAHTLLGNTHVVLAEIAYSADAKSEIQSRLLAMLPLLRNLNGTKDDDSGFCVGNVVFDLGNDYEEAIIAYAGGIAGVPVKIQFDINTFEQASDEPPLVQRGEANLEGLGIQTEKIRSGSRSLAGEAGDEWLGTFVDNGQRLHGFYAETRTLKPTRESPKVQVSLLTGDEEAPPTLARMTDATAIELWNRVIASIRKRTD